MQETDGDRPMLGAILVAQGALDGSGLDEALAAQAETGKRLGETLVQLGLICRPELDRALARQAGDEIQERTGFGTGLRAAIEQRHRVRRDFLATFR
jgi:hypothetical protein